MILFVAGESWVVVYRKREIFLKEMLFGISEYRFMFSFSVDKLFCRDCSFILK